MSVPSVWQLLAFSLSLLPIPIPKDAQGEGDLEVLYRMELAEACASVTSDRVERYLCMKIPRFESNYRIDVGRCEVKGAAGEVTAWQILPRSRTERDRLCRSLRGDAEVAVERIRESRRACWQLPKAEQLALYTRGDCGSVEGRRLSRHRWPLEGEVRRVE